MAGFRPDETLSSAHPGRATLLRRPGILSSGTSIHLEPQSGTTSMSHSRRLAPRFRSDFLDRLEERIVLSAAPAATYVLQATRPLPYVAPVSSNAAAGPGYAQTFLYRLNDQGTLAFSTAASGSSSTILPDGSGPLAGGPLAPAGLSPAQLRHIYSLDKISNLGSGQTLAIVDAYDDPNIFNDADTFDQQFMTTIGGTTSYYTAYGKATTWLTQAYASGTKPPGDTGWGQEISLDVEWMHAVAPQAKIMLVEAASNSFSDLLTAETYAVNHGATVISSSWGGGEFSGETGYDSTFSSASGVTFVFSAGDSGNQSYPAESPYVVAVGGTHLTYDSSYNWSSESGWSSGGGGVSRYEAKPGYQSGLSYSRRANPDVAYDADPYTGFAVYDSYGGYGWGEYGGTSAGAPQWSALLGIANQGRVAKGKSALDGYSQTLPAIYAMTMGTDGSEDLYDVTSGRNRVGRAGPGFDLVTGRGTPRRSDLIYNYLVGY
jgi:subtilase family serine protease